MRSVTRLIPAGLLGGALMLLGASAGDAQTDAAKREESERAFARIAEVLRHPRCMNCHPVGDSPRQTDDRHLHRMLVARGPDDGGTPAMRCATCHQTVNTADGRVPGAPHWHLAPRSMGWEGLERRRALPCPQGSEAERRAIRALPRSAHDVGRARSVGVESRPPLRPPIDPERVPRDREALGGHRRRLPVLNVKRKRMKQITRSRRVAGGH